MANYNVVYKGWRSLKEEVGNDLVYFDFEVFPETEGEPSFTGFVPYYYMKEVLIEMYPVAPKIIDQTLDRCTAWGPQESLLVTEMEECGINMETVLRKFIELNYDLDEEAARWASIRANPPKLDGIIKDLDDARAIMKQEDDIYFLLCERIQKVITNEVTNLFPILLNSSSDTILKMEDILVNHVSKMADDLTNLIVEA